MPRPGLPSAPSRQLQPSLAWPDLPSAPSRQLQPSLAWPGLPRPTQLQLYRRMCNFIGGQARAGPEQGRAGPSPRRPEKGHAELSGIVQNYRDMQLYREGQKQNYRWKGCQKAELSQNYRDAELSQNYRESCNFIGTQVSADSIKPVLMQKSPVHS